MTVYIRILLYVMVGFAVGKGWLDDEIRQYLTTDPEVVLAVEAAVSVVMTGPLLLWRWFAKKMGWST